MNRFIGLKPRLRVAAMSLMILFSLELLVACIPVLVATATVTGINVVTDRRTLGRNIDDNTLEIALRSDILLDDRLNGTHLSVTAINGIVLLTGEVATDSQRQLAETLAKSRTKTLTVVNEIQLAGTTSLTSRTNDSLITSKVKTKLLQSKAVQANAVKVVTEAGRVYLLGLVTRSEADAAVAATQTVGGVTHIVKVFEYIK
jgi:osmotically-inducible protein OsmY